MAWWWKQRPDLSTFDPNGHYTAAQLEEFASEMLRQDRASSGEDHGILNEDQLRERHSREVYNANGVPDPHLVSGIFGRVHVTDDGEAVTMNKYHAGLIKHGRRTSEHRGVQFDR
jgi:hypothetical protein